MCMCVKCNVTSRTTTTPFTDKLVGTCKNNMYLQATIMIILIFSFSYFTIST